MDSNLRASYLGEIARAAGNSKRKDVGDSIDRGLILERLLKEAGFLILDKDQVCKLQIKCLEMGKNG
jgi:hypothetical protein